jgi:hypothetical protein
VFSANGALLFLARGIAPGIRFVCAKALKARIKAITLKHISKLNRAFSAHDA